MKWLDCETGIKVVAMKDRWGTYDIRRGSWTRRSHNPKFPAIQTAGIITGTTTERNNKRIIVALPGGVELKYRAIDIEPLEILRDIFERDDEYDAALCELL